MIPLSPALTEEDVDFLIHGIEKVGASLEQ
jgi:hypothetical protein